MTNPTHSAAARGLSSLGLTRFCRCVVGLCALAFTAHAGGLAGQTSGSLGPRGGAPQLTAVEVLPRPYVDPTGSAAILEGLIGQAPDRQDLKIALVRELTAVSLLTADDDTRTDVLRRATEVGEELVRADSTSVEARYWLAAVLGMRAEHSGGREKIQLAREAHVLVLGALEMDPEHPGSNHLLGRLHAGTLGLNFVTRMIGRLLGLGDVMAEASWEGAESRLRLAAERDASIYYYRWDLANLLIQVGKEEEGWALMETLAELVPLNPLNALYVQLARERMEQRSS